MGFIEELSSDNVKLRHLSHTDIPSYIGGSKSPPAPQNCPLHIELLDKTGNRFQSSSNTSGREIWNKIKQELYGDIARKKLLQEIVKEVEERRDRHICMTKEQLLRIAENEPNHFARERIRKTIRGRTFQLEPIMYEDFIIL
jgi:hypothetical protein